MPRLSNTRMAFLKIKINFSAMIFWGLVTILLLPACGQSKPAPDLFSLPVTYKVGKKPAELKFGLNGIVFCKRNPALCNVGDALFITLEDY